jgi:hypothetical protein
MFSKFFENLKLYRHILKIFKILVIFSKVFCIFSQNFDFSFFLKIFKIFWALKIFKNVGCLQKFLCIFLSFWKIFKILQAHFQNSLDIFKIKIFRNILGTFSKIFGQFFGNFSKIYDSFKIFGTIFKIFPNSLVVFIKLENFLNIWTYCNEFAGFYFTMELYYSQSSIHNSQLQSATPVELAHGTYNTNAYYNPCNGSTGF